MSAPKEGDKRHGPKGDEIFHNGHWIQAGGKGDHAKENEHGKEHH